MRAWFEGLQPRERWLVLAGGVASVLILVWLLVLSPLRSEAATLRNAVAAKQRLLGDLARIEITQAPNSNGPVQGEGQTLVIIVNSTAESHGLALPRTRPNGPNGIDVTFQGASFDALIAWLIVLQANYAVEVESASFSSAREQGLVNGQLSLHRS
jgi:general secretion pathway protein M